MTSFVFNFIPNFLFLHRLHDYTPGYKCIWRGPRGLSSELLSFEKKYPDWTGAPVRFRQENQPSGKKSEAISGKKTNGSEGAYLSPRLFSLLNFLNLSLEIY